MRAGAFSWSQRGAATKRGIGKIFGQVKRAYEFARTAQLLNRLFQKSFQVGKQVRSSTANRFLSPIAPPSERKLWRQ
jgi:hypothetical protein